MLVKLVMIALALWLLSLAAALVGWHLALAALAAALPAAWLAQKIEARKRR